jgi:hypothetical protein
VREIHGHEANECNRAITIEANDQNPDNGNASHRYEVSINGLRRTAYNPQFISFQDGPIKEVGINGLTQEVLLAILIDRLECFQTSKYACVENETALGHVKAALEALGQRTKKREDRGVEGTHTV